MHRSFSYKIVHLAQSVALVALVMTAIALVASCIAAAAGFVPWLHLPMVFGDTLVADAGMYAQIALATFVSSLLFFVPMNRRVMQLERTHRDFQISMDDIAQAFYICHTADRAGNFTMSSEFDAVRERMVYMRDHPDLQSLEPAILEVAAQMSQRSQDLANIYDDEKVQRAKTFLQQRQDELVTHQNQIAKAMQVCQDLKTWKDTVTDEENLSDTKAAQLDRQLRETLDSLGYKIGKALPQTNGKVVSLGMGPLPEQA